MPYWVMRMTASRILDCNKRLTLKEVLSTEILLMSDMQELLIDIAIFASKLDFRCYIYFSQMSYTERAIKYPEFLDFCQAFSAIWW